MNIRRDGARRASAWAIAAAAALVIAGCGSDSDDDAATTAASSASGDGGSLVQDAQKSVDAAYEGTNREPASTGPAAQKGKNVWVIPCIASAPGCQAPAEGVKEAAKILDWKVTIADGKADPGVQSAAINRAVASGADGIILSSVDCSSVKRSLTAARAKNVPVVAVYSFDCDDPAVGSEALFAKSDIYGESPKDYFSRWGTLTADYIIAKTGGKAKVIVLTSPSFLNGEYKDKALKARLKECAECEVLTTISSPTTDNATGVAAQKVQTAFQQHPDANVLALWADSKTIATAQVVKTLKRRNPDLLVTGGEGNLENMGLIRSGTQDLAVGIPSEWLGWAGADALNRHLAGEEEQPDQGIGFQNIDKDHNLPEAEGKLWEPNTDFKAAYTKVWTGQ